MINKETLDYIDVPILKFENTHTMNEILNTGAPTIQPENGKLQKHISKLEKHTTFVLVDNLSFDSVLLFTHKIHHYLTNLKFNNIHP